MFFTWLHWNRLVTLHYIIFLKKMLKNTVTFNINTNSKSLAQSKTFLQKSKSHIEIS